MKRARTSGGSITGGTGDVKPQIFTIETGIAGAVDDYVVNTVVLPIPRFGTQKTKATVFEFLKCSFYLNIRNATDAQVIEAAFITTVTSRTDGETFTLGALSTDIGDPRTIACAVHTSGLTTSGSSAVQYPIVIDLTDNNGNGVLVATDRVSIVGGAVANSVVGNYICKILYRMTNIGVAEYVGIVQSQQ